MVSRETVESWIAAYERAWRTEGTESRGKPIVSYEGDGR